MRNVICVNELNEVMNCKVSATKNIVPGVAGTMFVGSDRYAIVVTEVVSPKHIKIAHLMNAHENLLTKNENGLEVLPSEYMEEYAKADRYDEYGYPLSYYHSIDYTYRKNGRWMPKGEGMWGTSSIHLGHAENYRDPSF